MTKTPAASLIDVKSGPLKPKAQLKVAREILYTRISIATTIAVAALMAVILSRIPVSRFESSHNWYLLQDALFVLVVYAFVYGSLLHQCSRLGYFKRLRSHWPADRRDLETVFDMDRAPALAVLVPSYREERRVVRQTLISSALLEYPNRRVVLLIDDPPHPSEPEAAAELEAMRRLPNEVQAMLTPLQARYADELRGFERRRARGSLDARRETERLAKLYQDAAAWLEDRANRYEVQDHTDALFVERILREPAGNHRARAAEISGWEKTSEPPVFEESLLHEYRRLAALFAVRLSVFERKRFVNLSHAPNKAMNLNSYIGMLGRNFREVIRSDGLHIEECDRRLAQLRFPQADYLITLDADSLLINCYALRLIHLMEQPGNERIAVAQTPYSAVPGERSLIERAAGAFTDIQYIVHQGYCNYGAAFWVGANALLRRTALEDICREAGERGFTVKKYIQDRTVIEDTESSLDLVARGWRIFNYMERLAYSATPPDFGALIVQRRRWANGGLLLLPKLLRHLPANKGIRHIPETLLRTYYLVATPVINLAMLTMLVCPFERHLEGSWPFLYLAALPYYLLFLRDLLATGYAWSDLLRVYSLSLLLIAVNLGGVAKSLQQWCTGQTTPFVRTPKVPGRTAAPPIYILMPGAIALCTLALGLDDLINQACFLAGFALTNAAAFGYASFRFIGVGAAFEDLGLPFPSRSRAEEVSAGGLPASEEQRAPAGQATAENWLTT